MTAQNREKLINQLKASYEGELPDIENPSMNGYLLHTTNTWICIGNLTVEKQDMAEAAAYFEKAFSELQMRSTSQKDLKKAEYCKIAMEAIRDKLKS